MPAPGKRKKWVDDSDPQAAMAEVMDGTPIKSVTCIACGDTGLNSRGGPCLPCEYRELRDGLSKPLDLQTVKQIVLDLFGD